MSTPDTAGAERPDDRAHEDVHLDLGLALADGGPIDWARALADARDEQDRWLLRSLQSVERVCTLHRSVTASARAAATAAMPATGSPPMPGAHPATLPAAVGRLQILGRLGAGAQGDVFRALDPTLKREVALKLLPPAHPRPLQEARRLASVKHPNVVVVYAAEQVDGRDAITMELVRGRTLAELLAREGRRGPSEIAAIGIDLCRALAAVHAAGLLHLDVKAPNVMREDGGRVVLMDFGAGESTPMYMAPELLRREPATVRCDLYSLGVLLFHLATAAYPMHARTLEELQEAHRTARMTRLRDLRPDLPAPLVQVIERALDADPARRFASAGEMERALADAMPAAARALAPPGGRARRWQWGAVAVVLAVATVAVVLLPRVLRRPPAGDSAPPDGLPWSLERLPPDALGAAGPGSYLVMAAAYRGSGRGEHRLAAGARLSPGDSLSMRLAASESLYVYVINEDERGEAYLLFPLPETEPQNPLPPEVTHVLPGRRAGQRLYWQVTSTGGREHLLLLASPRRLADLETDLMGLERARAGRRVEYARLSAAARARLRGIGGVTGGTGQGPAPVAQRLYELARPLSEAPERTSNIWLRRIEFENPDR